MVIIYDFFYPAGIVPGVFPLPWQDRLFKPSLHYESTYNHRSEMLLRAALIGILHFAYGQAIAGLVPLPGGVLFAYLTGIALMLASVGILTGKKDKSAALLPGIIQLVFAPGIHLVVVTSGDMMSMGRLLKDTSLAGAAFLYSGIALD